MKVRIISAIVAIAIFLPLLYIGGIPFILLVYAMATMGLYELLKMRKQPLISIQGVLSLILLWIILLPGQVFETGQGADIKMNAAILAVLLFLSYTVISKNKFDFDDAGFVTLSVLYVGIGFHFLMETREAGIVYLFYVLFVVWGTDSGAYFVGRSLGKRKLWPEISPNKTIGGSVGGILIALLIALAFYTFTTIDIPLLKLLIVTVILSVFGQLGDLAQSAFKRHYGVKDSGNIMPGHGGILDRCDSWLFVLPLFHLLQII
ncbi:MAG TPA: phosphatidate cytidylyltransferase [Bacillus bacterium]|uniref:Phosphatidate cytidylyltransferase n=1 Tax=Siminovitchia fordii TaxID=254759 RepID=A0ABQ4K193_9BACI|nr:phosphatidate cytidylyltransferase [Siminovitchia fordii]GIN18917.1 phosphatidate cytidylyltransferase [Siminovitchia fordii]HBZ10468.1 phosphatidate cytidylyltransferase [Bacillus sp. (in: firmicutes)]